MGGLLRDLRHASAEQLALRSAVVAATVLLVVLGSLFGEHPLHSPWLVLMPVGLALVAAVVPHGPAPLLLLGWLVLVWLLSDIGAADLVALPGSASLLVIHTASALAAALPVRAPVPAELWRCTLRRMAAVLAVVVLLWGALRLMAPAAPGPGPWGTVCLMVGVGVVAGGVTVYDQWARSRVAEQRTIR